jgi:hypothetical protein
VKRGTQVLLALFGCAALLVSAAAGAQGRGPSAQALRERAAGGNPATAEARVKEMTAWLARLAGEFRAVVTYAQSPIISPCGMSRDQTGPCLMRDRFMQSLVLPQFHGPASCIGVAAGPGVKCVLGIAGGSGELIPELPRVLLLGVDLAGQGIRMMEVDTGMGIARDGLGRLSRDTATFDMPCKKTGTSVDPVNCVRVLRISAPTHGKRIELTIQADATPRPGNRWLAPPGMTRIDLERTSKSGESPGRP